MSDRRRSLAIPFTPAQLNLVKAVFQRHAEDTADTGSRRDYRLSCAILAAIRRTERAWRDTTEHTEHGTNP